MTIAVSRNQKQINSDISSKLTADDAISVATVSDKYPQGFEEVLVPSVTGSLFPYGFSAVNLGVVVLGVQTLLSIYDAVTDGIPALTRAIALGGAGFKENVHVRVPVGTPWEVLVKSYGDATGEFRYTKNSLMTGETIEDLSLPVTKEDSALYAVREAHTSELLPFASPGFSKDSYSNTFLTSILPLNKKLDTNIHGEKRSCLSCSFCSDACPVGILPSLIHKYVLRDLIDEPVKQFGIFKCIDCNLCTYVCPSKIPVAELMRKGKEALIAEGLGNEEDTKLSFSLKGIES
jgi:Na+-translocating ferredoxin:NAD+ oxidoreductase RnfC subunit